MNSGMKTLSIASVLSMMLLAMPLSAGISEDIESLGKDDVSAETRADTLKRLKEKGLEAFDDLVEGLGNEKPAVRATCARLLGALADTRAVEHLLKLISPPIGEGEEKTKGEASLAVRIAAIDSLKRFTERPHFGTIGEAFEERIKVEGLDAVEKQTLASALADMVYAGARKEMEKYLDPAGSVNLGMSAARLLAGLDSSSSSKKLVSFCDDKKTEGEGDEAKEVWSYPSEWLPIRQFAILTLVRKGHSDGVRLLVEEVQEGKNKEQIVIDELAKSASRYGMDLVDRLIEILKDKTTSKGHDTAHKLLAKLGKSAVQKIVELAEEGLEIVRKAKEEGKTEPDPYSSIVTRALTNLRSEETGRDGMLQEYLARKGNKDEDEIRDDLFDALLASNSRQARAAILDGFTSDNIEHVKKSIQSWMRIFDGRDFDRLNSLVTHKEKDVRMTLAESLSDSRFHNRTRPMLLTLSQDAEEDVRAAVWKGLGKGDEASLIDEFSRGMSDKSEKVQIEAAKAFDGLMLLLKLGEDEDENKRNRDRIIDLVESKLKGEEGAAIGITEDFGAYNRALFQPDDEGSENLIPLIQGFLEAKDGRLRAAASRLYRESFWDKEWTQTVVYTFKEEKDPSAAYAHMDAIANKYSVVDESDLRRIVSPCVGWLAVEKNDDDTRYIPARQAAITLGKLGERGLVSQHTKVLSDVKRAMELALGSAEAGKHDPASVSTLKHGVDVFIKMKATNETSFVIGVLEKVSNSQLQSFANTYLSSYAAKADLTRIDSLKNLAQHYKDQIRKAAERRGGN